MKEKVKTEFEFCKVCNRNHEEGQRHKFLPHHKRSLSPYLSRFQNKLADIRHFLKKPAIRRPEHASPNRFWCVFCDTDIDETGSSFACANGINHLASEDHLKNLKHFLWKYGGGMDFADTFRISEADVRKWEEKCMLLENGASPSINGPCAVEIGPNNDIQNELSNCQNMNEFGNSNFDPIKSNFSYGVMPLQSFTYEHQISHPAVANAGSFVADSVSAWPAGVCSSSSSFNSRNLTGGVNWNSLQPLPYNRASSTCNLQDSQLYQGCVDQGLVNVVSSSNGSQHINQFSSRRQEKAKQNVHTGAPPPWFEATEENQLNSQLKPISSSFSSSNKSGKTLNPKRVGVAWAERRMIEMEMEKRGEIVKNDYDPNWLPNFGRVWQSGSRKESRKEFEHEKNFLPKVESQSDDVPVFVQPYISKRMRLDANK